MEDRKIRLLKLCHFMMACIGIIIILTSVAIFFGILSNTTELTSIFPYWINTKVNTAACFLLAGIALLFLYNQNRGFFANLIFSCLSIIIFLVSSLTIIEYVSGVDFGIDQLLLKDNLPFSPGTSSPGRMTFTTAINFMILSLSFLLSLRKSISVWAIQALAWLILFIAFISLCNYLNATETIYAINKFTTMSMYTSWLFLLLGFGILLNSPDDGVVQLMLKDSTGGFLMRSLLPIIIFVPLILNLFENILENKHLIDPNGDMLNIAGNYVVIGLLILLLARLIDRKDISITKAKKQIQHNEMIFRQFAENIDIVFYITSSDFSEVLYVSKAYESIWGKSVESLYKNPNAWFESIIPADQKKAYQIFFTDFSNENTSASSEFRIKKPDGSIRNIFARCYRVRDENRNAFCVIGISVDMTNTIIDNLCKEFNSDILHLLESENNIKVFTPKCLKLICCKLDWDLGELWLLDESNNTLCYIDAWQKNVASLINFDNDNNQYKFSFGEGFLGKVWKEKRLIWIEDYTTTDVFSRAEAAKLAGLNSAIAIPILYQNKFFGILSFFRSDRLKPDRQILSAMENIGKSIGEFLVRTHHIENIRDILRHDSLTGLLNRTALEEDLDSLIENQKPGSIIVMLIDMDRFKLINEAFGHDCGDILLKSIAKKLCEITEPKIINIARLADKFILYIPEADNNDANNYANIIIRNLSGPFEINKKQLSLTMSIGITMYPQNALDSKSLINGAVLAMEQAKNMGGNQINFFTKELPSIASHKMSMDTDLRKAITDNQFILVYQPQVDLKSDTICAAEALVRWQHPIKGLIYPNMFIPFAEKIGLIVSLNEHIMRMVFQQITNNWSGPPISINISAQQFHPGFHLVDYLESLTKEFSTNPNLIELEITENMLIENTDHNIAVLNVLHELGFKISIDDFGTGFSSFSYLNRFPIHKIKIDKSFITGLPESLANAKIVRAIIHMIHDLDMVVLAEGAETNAEVRFLKAENCDIVQGYYYYKPMSFDDLRTVIGNKPNTVS